MKKFFQKVWRLQNLLLLSFIFYLIEFIVHSIDSKDDGHTLGLHYAVCIMSFGCWAATKVYDVRVKYHKDVVDSQKGLVDYYRKLYYSTVEKQQSTDENNKNIPK